MYTLYILKCGDSSLYTGITRNLKNRLKTHRAGKGSKYVRSHLPIEVIYTEQYTNKILAAKREAEIKSWTRQQKIKKLKLKV